MISFGAYESKKDNRDIESHQILDKADLIPEKFDIDIDYHTNQRAIGICTASSICNALYKMYGIHFSHQFIYTLGKKLIDKNNIEGSSIRTMLTIVNKYGALPLSMNPQDDTRKSLNDYMNVTFTDEQMKEALKYRVNFAKCRLDPVGFAEDLYKSKYGLITRMDTGGGNFYTPSWDKNDLQYLRKPTAPLGGHAIVVKGYDGLNEGQIRTLHNSWGGRENPTTDSGLVWSDDGDLKYEYKTQKPHVTEAWVITPYSPAIQELKKEAFKINLKQGMTHPDVKRLQVWLNNNGFTVIEKGKETEFFGNLTKKAVIQFQKKYGIIQTGNFFELTRGKLNSMI